jgi:hypothetical protein
VPAVKPAKPAPGYRSKTFPTVSGGWVISNEGFFPAQELGPLGFKTGKHELLPIPGEDIRTSGLAQRF